LATILDESESYQTLLLESARSSPSSVEDLEEVLEPFAEWEFLEREDKRALLALICPEIRVFQTQLNPWRFDSECRQAMVTTAAP
jgi:hypothetical protein